MPRHVQNKDPLSKYAHADPCRLQYGRLPYVALAFLGRQASGSNAASEGCHSTGQLVMSDKQTTIMMSNDTLEKLACLRNSRMLHVRALA
jgi:hypothetical protein